ncbi:YqaE/Pmp3 family membrane protein [Roseibacillus ishigakijimensis]|uniref:YqaE/Pmp3 family membrane protein n=1 Tax=Roseibacillus ishigakijimensis TaxID=454146 RepID=A0A934RKG8_9BACT|nr:YqaE/Pmp3 family membrane protein [Roseibacillus ishigakijimensis]MBK1833084.1 YqaE/Pmp3 family membrane protein [Roseibacillus ishigakijimensis]
MNTTTTQTDGKTRDLLRIVLAILLPPLGVFFQVGFGLHFWLNILLTIAGYIPGIIHALWVILKE